MIKRKLEDTKKKQTSRDKKMQVKNKLNESNTD